MKINHMMCKSKTLRNLCLVKEKGKTKKTFTKDAYSVLVIKMY